MFAEARETFFPFPQLYFCVLTAYFLPALDGPSAQPLHEIFVEGTILKREGIQLRNWKEKGGRAGFISSLLLSAWGMSEGFPT